MSSLIIALCAMIVTIWQGVLTRKHNRLSVMPHIDFERDGAPGNLIHINLLNHGAGPAFLERVHFGVGGEKWNIKSPEDFKLVCEKLDICLKTFNHTFTFFNEGTVLGSDKEFILMSFPKAEENYELSKGLIDKLFKLTIEIEYSCTYKKKYKAQLPGFQEQP